jgi:hypothetical protein
MNESPKTICLQIKDKNGVFLASMIFDYPSETYLRESFRLAKPLLALHANTTEVLVNLMNIQFGSVSVEKGVIQNPNRLRQEHYYRTGN